MKKLLCMVLILLQVGGVSASSTEAALGSSQDELAVSLRYLSELNEALPPTTTPERDDALAYLREVKRILNKYVNSYKQEFEIAEMTLEICAKAVCWKFKDESLFAECGLAYGNEVRTLAWKLLLKAASFGQDRLAPVMLSTVERLNLVGIAKDVIKKFPFYSSVFLWREGQTFTNRYGEEETSSVDVCKTVETGSVFPPQYAQILIDDVACLKALIRGK